MIYDTKISYHDTSGRLYDTRLLTRLTNRPRSSPKINPQTESDHTSL